VTTGTGERNSNDEMRLEGERCAACGAVYFPSPPLACRSCGKDRFEALRLLPTGTVLAATQVAAPPAGFAGPYGFALIQLDDGPTVFAPLEGAAGHEDRVVAIPRPIRDGRPGFGFRILG